MKLTDIISFIAKFCQPFHKNIRLNFYIIPYPKVVCKPSKNAMLYIDDIYRLGHYPFPPRI